MATLRRFDQGAARLKLEHEQLEMKKAELHLAQEAQKKRTEAEWREWAKACQLRLNRECKTPEELYLATIRLIFGEVDLEQAPDDAGAHRNDANTARQTLLELMRDSAARMVKVRDELATAKAEMAVQENQCQMAKTEASDALLTGLNIPTASPRNNTEDASAAENQDLSTQDSQAQSNPVKP